MLTQRPNRTPALIPLDAIIARAGAAPQPHARREPRHAISLIAPSRERTGPTALVMHLEVRRCACGSLTRCPPLYVLAEYSPTEAATRYSRADAADCTGLPRRTQVREVSIPFCEECF